MPPKSGVQKRMRKGTKSCLPCRKRKIRCSGVVEGGSCSECKARGDASKCIAQGIVLDDGLAFNRRLQERVAELEARLAELDHVRNDWNPAQTNQGTQDERSPQEALSHLLGGIPGPTHDHDNSALDDEEEDEGEEELENAAAPLMRILTNPVLGVGEDASGTSEPGSYSLPSRSKPNSASKAAKDHSVLRELCAHMPSEAEMADILDNHSSWWSLYRGALSLAWADDQQGSLRSLALQAFNEGHPSLLGLLLVCFAISTGDLQRFLPPVEKHILYNDDYAATEYGFNCMMAIGLCYMGSLQPRRAWTIYRRANSLLQLNGLHQKRRSEKQDLIFWQLFHADRWVSLIIGLPYVMSDHFCDITIPSKDEISTDVWLYRHYALITGRLIDTLHSVKGPSLAMTMQVDEELEELIPDLPQDYLNIAQISSCQDQSEKCTRLYRSVHWHLLRSLVHLPFFLQEENHNRYEFSRKACIHSSRTILEGYLEIIDMDPMMAYHGTIINYTAFAAAIIVLLGLIHYGRPKESEGPVPQWRIEEDWRLIRRVLQALRDGSNYRITRVMCGKCHAALESLVASVEGTDEQSSTRVVLPYFGTISITRKPQASKQTTSVAAPDTLSSYSEQPNNGFAQPIGYSSTFPVPQTGYGFPNSAFDMAFTYQGPFLPDVDTTAWMLGDDFWTNQVYDDWSWLSTDLPPSSGI